MSTPSEEELAAYIRGIRHGWDFGLTMIEVGLALPDPAEGLRLAERQLREVIEKTDAAMGPLDRPGEEEEW